MKLKGKNSNKIKSEKVKKTLERMETVRKEDNLNLRKVLNDKLEWAIEEKKKGLASVEMLVIKINELKIQCIKLDGAIVAMQDILKIKKEEK